MSVCISKPACGVHPAHKNSSSSLLLDVLSPVRLTLAWKLELSGLILSADHRPGTLGMVLCALCGAQTADRVEVKQKLCPKTQPPCSGDGLCAEHSSGVRALH